jgi:hypothetical protein
MNRNKLPAILMGILLLATIPGCSRPDGKRGIVEPKVLSVRVLGIDQCPGAKNTARRVEHEAVARGLRIDLQLIVVRTPEEARRERFLGSPTVQINGRDIEPQARDRKDFTFS